MNDYGTVISIDSIAHLYPAGDTRVEYVVSVMDSDGVVFEDTLRSDNPLLARFDYRSDTHDRFDTYVSMIAEYRNAGHVVHAHHYINLCRRLDLYMRATSPVRA